LRSSSLQEKRKGEGVDLIYLYPEEKKRRKDVGRTFGSIQLLKGGGRGKMRTTLIQILGDRGKRGGKEGRKEKASRISFLA